jgi:ABC-2 type transport system permease protein
MKYFAGRNLKEMLRDRLNLFFGLLFPLLILTLLYFINRRIPASAGMELFQLKNLTPGVAVFGLSFVSLFGGMLIARDRSEAFLTRLYSSPLRAADYIFGYILPLLPLALGQIVCLFLLSYILGLAWEPLKLLLCLLTLLPSALLFAGIGLLCGSLLTDRQVGGVCGALLTNLTAWLSGTWFSLDLFGEVGKKLCYILPFANAVDSSRAALTGGSGMAKLWIVAAYAVGTLLLAVAAFSRQMRRG